MGCSISACFSDSENKVEKISNDTRPIQELTKSRTSAQSSHTYNEEEIDLSHFLVQDKIIGLGGFGLVRKATKISGHDNGVTYALKSLNKASIFRRNSGPSAVMTELKALAILKNSKFICNIQYAFQDPIYLHLVLDLALGGDLRYNLRTMQNKRFPETVAKFYAVQIIFALHTCHTNSILHRDIKPENIVLMDNGYVKLTDFGVAKILDNIHDCRSTSGTHGYMAPEIYSPLHRHGPASDWFSLGVTLHELLIGRRPFETSRLLAFKENWDNKDTLHLNSLHRISYLSPSCKSFLSSILQVQVVHRLGYRDGINEFRYHPWLYDQHWENIWNMTEPPPFLPNSKSNCFDVSFRSTEEQREYARAQASLLDKNNKSNMLVDIDQSIFHEYAYHNKYLVGSNQSNKGVGSAPARNESKTSLESTAMPLNISATSLKDISPPSHSISISNLKLIPLNTSLDESKDDHDQDFYDSDIMYPYSAYTRHPSKSNSCRLPAIINPSSGRTHNTSKPSPKKKESSIEKDLSMSLNEGSLLNQSAESHLKYAHVNSSLREREAGCVTASLGALSDIEMKQMVTPVADSISTGKNVDLSNEKYLSKQDDIWRLLTRNVSDNILNRFSRKDTKSNSKSTDHTTRNKSCNHEGSHQNGTKELNHDRDEASKDTAIERIGAKEKELDHPNSTDSIDLNHEIGHSLERQLHLDNRAPSSVHNHQSSRYISIPYSYYEDSKYRIFSRDVSTENFCV